METNKMSNNEKRAAYNKAGQAVAAYLLDNPLQIEKYILDVEGAQESGEFQTVMERGLTPYLAGYVAEDIIFGDGAKKTGNKIKQASCRCHTGVDLRGITLWFQEWVGTQPRWEEWTPDELHKQIETEIIRQIRSVTSLLIPNWSAVERLAEALLERELSEAEATEVITQTLADFEKTSTSILRLAHHLNLAGNPASV